MIDQNELTSLFEYKDGKLLYRASSGRCVKGCQAGTLNYTGYINIKVKGKMYRAHRLIFMYHFGYFPEQVDHINGVKDDNRIENLRSCNNSENKMNTSLCKSNVSGTKGVSWHKNTCKWRACIYVSKKQIHIGYFSELSDARDAIRIAREDLHKDFCNHG